MVRWLLPGGCPYINGDLDCHKPAYQLTNFSVRQMIQLQLDIGWLSLEESSRKLAALFVITPYDPIGLRLGSKNARGAKVSISKMPPKWRHIYISKRGTTAKTVM